MEAKLKSEIFSHCSSGGIYFRFQLSNNTDIIRILLQVCKRCIISILQDKCCYVLSVSSLSFHGLPKWEPDVKSVQPVLAEL